MANNKRGSSRRSTSTQTDIIIDSRTMISYTTSNYCGLCSLVTAPPSTDYQYHGNTTCSISSQTVGQSDIHTPFSISILTRCMYYLHDTIEHPQSPINNMVKRYETDMSIHALLAAKLSPHIYRLLATHPTKQMQLLLQRLFNCSIPFNDTILSQFYNAAFTKQQFQLLKTFAVDNKLSVHFVWQILHNIHPGIPPACKQHLLDSPSKASITKQLPVPQPSTSFATVGSSSVATEDSFKDELLSDDILNQSFDLLEHESIIIRGSMLYNNTFLFFPVP